MSKIASGAQDRNFLKNMTNRLLASDQDHGVMQPSPAAAEALFMKETKQNPLKLKKGDPVKLFEGEYVINGVFERYEHGKYYIEDKQGFFHMCMADADLSHPRYHGAILISRFGKGPKYHAGYKPELSGAIKVEWSEAKTQELKAA